METSCPDQDLPDIGEFASYRNRGFVVVVSAGRTGSTLLQGILNSFPGYLIRGENFGLMYGLYLAEQSLRKAGLHSGDDAANLAWFGATDLDPEAFRHDAALLIARQLVGRRFRDSLRAIGFKEIRWTAFDIGDSDLADYLHFIQRVFPLAKFILLTRNIDEIMSSGWWPPADMPETRSHIETFYTAARAAKLNALFEIDYKEIVENGRRLQEMCEFLGEKHHPKIAEVLKIRHAR